MNEALRQRQPRIEDEAYLKKIRLLPCCVCGRAGPSDAAHIRMSDAAFGGQWGKRSTGGGERPSDRWAVPLCRPTHLPDSIMMKLTPGAERRMIDIGCHGRQHGHEIGFLTTPVDQQDVAFRDSNEVRFWQKVGKNPFIIADTLYRDLGSGESAFKKPKRARPKPKQPKNPDAPKRKIAGKGFDKTKTRKMDGSVTRRTKRK